MKYEISENPVFTEEEAKLIRNLDFDKDVFPDWLEVRNVAQELGINVDFTEFEYKLKKAINQYKRQKKVIVREIKEFLDYARRKLTHIERRLDKTKLSERENMILEECHLIIHYTENTLLKKAENPEDFDYEEFFIEKYDFEDFIEMLEEKLQ